MGFKKRKADLAMPESLSQLFHIFYAWLADFGKYNFAAYFSAGICNNAQSLGHVFHCNTVGWACGGNGLLQGLLELLVGHFDFTSYALD